MAEGAGTAAAPGAAGPGEIPEIRKPDFQMLLQDNAQLRRDYLEARRDSDRRVSETRDNARFEMERMRSDLQTKLGRADRENDALIAALGRLREENDRLREEVVVLKLGKNGHAEPKAPIAEAAAPTAAGAVKFDKTHLVAVVPQLVPPLGKSFPIVEPPEQRKQT